MARVKLNPVLLKIRGKVGELVFKHYGKEAVISRPPDFEGVEPTEAQLAQRQRLPAGGAVWQNGDGRPGEEEDLRGCSQG